MKLLWWTRMVIKHKYILNIIRNKLAIVFILPTLCLSETSTFSSIKDFN